MNDKNNVPFSKVVKPMKKTLDIETMKREQGFKPIDKKAFFQEIDALEIKESIDDLLKMI
ncbi:MAG: hypothetical protein ACPG5B_02385 [Chitinophagales bacterium]